jgi:hypothetical protein
MMLFENWKETNYVEVIFTFYVGVIVCFMHYLLDHCQLI